MNVMHQRWAGDAVPLEPNQYSFGPVHYLLLRDLLREDGLQIGVGRGLEASDPDAFIPGGQRPASPRDQLTSRECPTHGGDLSQRLPFFGPVSPD